MASAHETLDGIDGILWVRDRLPFGRLTDERLALIGKSGDTGGDTVTFLIGDDLRLATFHDRNDRIRCAEIDPDDFFALCGHFSSPIALLRRLHSPLESH